jgi:hypothetical protein
MRLPLNERENKMDFKPDSNLWQIEEKYTKFEIGTDKAQSYNEI